MTTSREQLEFLLSQRADGTLTVAENAVVEAALAGDASLRALSGEYERMGSLLARVRAERVQVDARTMSAAVRGAIRTDLEFQLSQALDLDLEPADIARLEATVRGTPDLAESRSSMARLDEMLGHYAARQPSVDMSKLAANIRREVTRETVRERAQGRGWRIAVFAAPLAAAAAIALAVIVSRVPSVVSPKPTPDATPMVAVKIDVPVEAKGGRIEVTFDHNEPAEFAKAREEGLLPRTGVARGPRPKPPAAVKVAPDKALSAFY